MSGSRPPDTLEVEPFERLQLHGAPLLMKFFCDRCNAKYSISDEKVRGKVVKVRCKRCGDIIEVSERTNQAGQSTPKEGGSQSRADAGGNPGAEEEWYYSVEGQTFGPLSKDRLVDKYKSGELSANSYLWKNSFSDWQPANQVEPFAAILDQQAKQASNRSRPRRGTMDGNDSIEAVDAPSDDGKTQVTSRSAFQTGGSDSGGLDFSGMQGEGASESGGSSSSEERTSSAAARAEDRGRGDENSGSGRRRNARSSGRRSTRSKGRSRDRDRRGSRDKTDEETSGEGRSSSERRRERLKRLRGKLKSNFDPEGDESGGAESSSPSLESPDTGGGATVSAAAAGGGGRSTPSERAEEPSPSSGGGVVGASGQRAASAGEAAAVRSEQELQPGPGEEGSPGVDAGQSPPSAEDLLDETSENAAPESDGARRSRAESADPGPGVDIGSSAPDELEAEAEDGQELEESDEAELEELSLDALQPLEDDEAEPSAEAEREEDGFSLPPSGSSRLGGEGPESDGLSTPDLPGDAQGAPAVSEPEDESDEGTIDRVGDEEPSEDDGASLPSAPKLGDDESAAKQQRSQADGMTQSLLIQLDKIQEESSKTKYIGLAAAVAILASGGVLTWHLMSSSPAESKAKQEGSSGEEEVTIPQNDGPTQKTYSQDEHDKILSISPQKVQKDSDKESPEGEGTAEEGSSGGSQGSPLVEGRSLTESEGPSMEEAIEAANKRSGESGKGPRRNVEESGSVSKGESGESMPNSRSFEAMQAIEGSSPSVENPTEAAKNRGSSGGGQMPLSKEQIRQGIKGVRESIASCRRRHGRRGTPMSVRKIYLTLTIEPSGKVSGYSISPEKLNGMVFERCLSSHKGRWHFGPFEGSAQKLKAPFILQ